MVNPATVNVPIPTTLTPHAWTPDSTGLYHTTTNLAAEWQGYYQQMLSGQVDELTPVQRLEGNAEAVFENTGLKNLSAAQQAVDREDAQREFDAIAAALKEANINGPLPRVPTSRWSRRSRTTQPSRSWPSRGTA